MVKLYLVIYFCFDHESLNWLCPYQVWYILQHWAEAEPLCQCERLSCRSALNPATVFWFSQLPVVSLTSAFRTVVLSWQTRKCLSWELGKSDCTIPAVAISFGGGPFSHQRREPSATVFFDSAKGHVSTQPQSVLVWMYHRGIQSGLKG